MAKKQRPSFSSTTQAPEPSTNWVYRTASDAIDAAPADQTSRHARAHAIVARYAAGSAVASVVPIPMLDLAAIGGVQMAMIGALAREYGHPFERDSLAAVLSSAGGAMATRWAARGAGGSLLKAIPGIGTVAALFAMPAFASASTYAIGRVFIKHFESGGAAVASDELEAELRTDLESL